MRSWDDRESIAVAFLHCMGHADLRRAVSFLLRVEWLNTELILFMFVLEHWIFYNPSKIVSSVVEELRYRFRCKHGLQTVFDFHQNFKDFFQRIFPCFSSFFFVTFITRLEVSGISVCRQSNNCKRGLGWPSDWIMASAISSADAANVQSIFQSDAWMGASAISSADTALSAATHHVPLGLPPK